MCLEAVEEARAWLVERRAEGIIKHVLTSDFNVGSLPEAEKAYRALSRLKSANPELVSKVHPQTLAAFARQRIRNGEEVALEVLGLDAFTHVVISKPR